MIGERRGAFREINEGVEAMRGECRIDSFGARELEAGSARLQISFIRERSACLRRGKKFLAKKT